MYINPKKQWIKRMGVVFYSNKIVYIFIYLTCLLLRKIL